MGMQLILTAAAISFVVTLLTGKPLIRWLQKKKFGQKILEIGPRWHMNKQYTPTMGGIMFIFGITVAMAVMAFVLWGGLTGMHALGQYFGVLLLALAYCLVGVADDWAKIRKKQNAGLTPKQKLALQIVVAAVFVSLLRLTGALTVNAEGAVGLWVWGKMTGEQVMLYLPWVVYLLFGVLAVVAENNAVNLTDGIDGLAAGVTLPVAIFFAAVGAVRGNVGVMVFAGALAGGLAAFLVYNFNPARVFMGDTGSLFLGGAVAGLAFACDMPLMLLPVGFIYLVETVSVVLQVGYFKLSHGKRLFKMAPIHHHFEMCGWSERKIFAVFVSVTAVLCVLSWVLFI